MDFEEHLTRSGITWAKPSRKEQGEVARGWRELYGSFWSSRPKFGQRAEYEYAARDCREYYIGPLPGSRGGLKGLYACRGNLLAGLGESSGIEVFVTPRDLAWTMIFHHDGPLFLLGEWSGSTRSTDKPSRR